MKKSFQVLSVGLLYRLIGGKENCFLHFEDKNTYLFATRPRICCIFAQNYDKNCL